MTSTILQVSFSGVKESYFLGQVVEVKYSIKDTLTPSSRDWIGLYKVGWQSCDNYETYLWAPAPPGSADATKLEGTVTFPAEVLPKDSKDFYQFCYVSSAKQVCGVSTPFQFLGVEVVDDLVEIQDPDDPTAMVIKTKAQVQLEQMDELHKEVQLLQLELEAERVSKGQLMDQLSSMAQLQDQLTTEKGRNELLQSQITELQEALRAERQSNEQLHDQMRRMRDELKTDRKAHEQTLIEHSQGASAPLESDSVQLSLGVDDQTAAQKTSSAEARGQAEAKAKSPSVGEKIAGSLLKHLKRASDWIAEVSPDEITPDTAPEHTTSVDKTEESLNTCPVCSEKLPADATEDDIASHVESHNGQVCPICFMQFDKGYPEDNVSAHVNRHLDNPEEVASF